MAYGQRYRAKKVVGTTGTFTIPGTGGCTLKRIVVTKFAASAVVEAKVTDDTGASLHIIDASAAACQGNYDLDAYYQHDVFVKVTGGAAEITVVYC